MKDPLPTLEIVRTQGRRLTPQRRLVLEILSETAEHLDAEAIYTRARARDEHISLATIYRSLALLKQVGLVTEHTLGQDHGHFEPVKSNPHYHFTCQKCGTVIEFSSPKIEKTLLELQKKSGVLVTQAHFHVNGLCPDCQQNTTTNADAEKYLSKKTKANNPHAKETL